MPITLSDFLSFPFNNGKGIRTNQLWGEFVKSIGGDGIVLSQTTDGSERSIALEDVIGAIGSNASVRVVHAANVVLGRADTYTDAGFEWPELIPFLLVQWNPAGDSQHAKFEVIYNPRLGRFPGDTTGITAAAVGDAPTSATSTGFAVPHGIAVDDTRAIMAAQVDFGKTSTNQALVSCSDATLDPTPLVVLAITPAQVGVGPAKERVLQPEVDQTAAAGVTSLVLPEDYTDYEYLELTVFDPNPAAGVGNRATDFIRVKTDWLETQTDGNAPLLAVLDSDEAGSRQWLTWTPSTRTLARAVQGTNTARIRISSARLYDTSVTTDAPEGGGLTPAQEAKFNRYPENPAATPAAHLEPYSLIGGYSSIAYVQVEFDTYNIDPGEVMVPPSTDSGTRHGVLIGIQPEDSDAIDYAEVGLSFRLFNLADNSVLVSGTAASVSSHEGNTVLLVSISDFTVNSFAAGTGFRIEFGNKISKLIADAQNAASSSSGGLTDNQKRHYATTDVEAIDAAAENTGKTHEIVIDQANYVWEDNSALTFAQVLRNSALGQKIQAGAGSVTLAELKSLDYMDTRTLDVSSGEVQLVGRLSPRKAPSEFRLVQADGTPVAELDISEIVGGDDGGLYYVMGVYNSAMSIKAQTRISVGATKFDGDLGGRALAQVEKAAAGKTFGRITTGAATPLAGYTYTGYSSVAGALAAVGTIDGETSENIGGIYTATVKTSTEPAIALIEQGKTYYAKPEGGAGSIPVLVIIDDIAYKLRGPFGFQDRFFEVQDFAGFSDTTEYRVQVIFETGQDWIIDRALNSKIETNKTGVSNALKRTAIFKPLSVWERTNEARILLFEYRPIEAVHTNVNASLRIGGSTINNVNPSEGLVALDDIGTILAVPITQVQATNITSSSDARAGYVRCQITAGSADTITGWMQTEISGKWRELSGSSPYNILETDDEFMVELSRRVSGNTIVANVQVARIQLSTTAKRFVHHTQNPDNASEQIGAIFTLTSATSLTVSKLDTTNNDWTLDAVYAR